MWTFGVKEQQYVKIHMHHDPRKWSFLTNGMCAKSRMTISCGNVFTFCTISFKWIYSSKGPFVLFNYFGQWSMSNQTNKEIMSLRLLLDKFVWIMTMYFQINCHCNFDVAFNYLRNKSGTLKGTFCYHHHHLSVRIRDRFT